MNKYTTKQQTAIANAMTTTQLSQAQQALLKELNVNYKTGLTNDEASKRREEHDSFNTIDPPVKCPGWVCCLLPCIKSIPSMKAFRQLQPEDAEIRRNGKWTRYDATSLVRGDVLRLEEGDVVPADVVVLSVTSHDLLVDVHGITGQEKPRVIVITRREFRLGQQALLWWTRLARFVYCSRDGDWTKHFARDIDS